MKKEYDLTNAERGKFYRPDANLSIPVYLDDEVRDFVSGIAEQKKTDMSEVVNELLRSNMTLAKAMQ